MDVVVVGAYTRDLFMYGTRLPLLGETVNCSEYAEADGGKGANQAVAAARLGTAVTLITAVGADEFGRRAKELFAKESVDIGPSREFASSKTGVGFIVVDEAGHQLITTFLGAGLELGTTDIEGAAEIFGAAKVLLLQGELPLSVSIASVQLAGPDTVIIVDPSPVETFTADLAAFSKVDIVTPNEPEAAILTGRSHPTAAEVAAAVGVPTVVLTRGGSGVEVYWRGETHIIEASATTVVDTTGAGDAFNGALASGLAGGMDVLEAARLGVRCAAFSVGRRHCIPSFPRRKDIPGLPH